MKQSRNSNIFGVAALSICIMLNFTSDGPDENRVLRQQNEHLGGEDAEEH